MGVGDGRRTNAQLARAVDDGVGTHLAALERQRRGERLHDRARLEGIGDRPVAQLCAREMLAVVGVVGRQVDQREDFAGSRVEHHGATSLGIVFLDGRLELAVGQVLDLGIERQAHILAVLRRLECANVLDDVAAPVANHATTAGAPEQAWLKGQLDALQALVVDPGETNDVRRHVAGRIVTAVFLFLVHAGQLERGDAVGRLRRHLALDEDEGLFRRDLAIQFAHAHIEQGRQLLLLRAAHGSCVAGNRPDRLHRRRHCQHVAVAVDNLAARGGDLDVAAITRLTLFLQEVVVDHLQIETTPDQRRKSAHQQQADRP